MKNQHIIDRSARIILGVIIGATTLLNAFGPYLSWVLAAIGAVLIITGAIGVCPIYSILKFKTIKSCECKNCACARK